MGFFKKSNEVKRSDKEQDAVNLATSKLKLYQMQSCPYCIKVRMAMKELNLNIELRDINLNKEWEQELISHGGKRQVPCLRIEETSGQRWLYESMDIINFLKTKFNK